MATQSQKYVGKELTDNAVLIDYINKSVSFKPIKSEDYKPFKHFLTLWLIYISVCFLLSIPSFLISQMLFILSKDIFWDFYFRSILVCAVVLFSAIVSLGMTYYYTKEDWRKEEYPRYLARLIIWFRKIISFGRHKAKWLKINKDAIINKRLVLDRFSNLILKYKMTGDFKKYLKNVRITNKFEENTSDWMIIFKFTKPIKTGDMYIYKL